MYGQALVRFVLNFELRKAFFTTTNVYLARVNLNIAITAMVIEKQINGNQSSAVCEREYELGPNSFNSSLSGEIAETPKEYDAHDSFDWTNRQSGLMLGTGLYERFECTCFRF